MGNGQSYMERIHYPKGRGNAARNWKSLLKHLNLHDPIVEGGGYVTTSYNQVEDKNYPNFKFTAFYDGNNIILFKGRLKLPNSTLLYSTDEGESNDG
jgi:hypothetical protein